MTSGQANSLKPVDWYFDYVSPFAYLQNCRLGEVSKLADITYRPVLFAGLLRQWETKGPAEIPGKRLLTYRHAHWLAGKMGVPYRMPPHHPFNPLRALRLTIALGCGADVVQTIFQSIWVDGLLPDSEDGWAAIIERLGISDVDELLAGPSVKLALQENGDRAAAQEVFGVPTFVADGHLFWGVDTTDMLLDFLSHPGLFEDPEMARLPTVAPSTSRRT